MLLCLAWLLPGLVGHAPWKGGDGSNFVRFLALWQHADWVAHGLAYDAYPPLYYWVATATAWLTSPVLALHDGARLASGVFVALALFFSARTAQELYGDDHRWAAVLALLGSVGLLLRAHEMNAYTAQLAGVAIVLDGLARLPKDACGGWVVAAGLSVMLLATGLMEPLALALLAACLPVLIPAYRSEAAKRGLLLGLLSATALCLTWIILLWVRQEPLLQVLQLQRWLVWVQAYQLKPMAVLGLLPWYIWPGWPLAGWAIYRARRTWREPATLMPLLVLLVLLAVFSIGINSGEAKILAITAPTALLAAAGLMTLRRGAANAFLWFAVMLFAFLGIVFWVYWSAHDLAVPARLAKRLIKLGGENIGDLRLIPLLTGIVATLVWLFFIARVPRSPLRPILVWSAGISFVWVLLLGLFLDVFDPRLSYTRVAEVLSKQIPRGECVNTRNVGSQQRVLLAYHSGLDLRTSADCGWLLVQGKRRESPEFVEPRWELRQQTQRVGDRVDLFRLYARRR
ncbi:MAG: hypothetical protein ABL892_13695 [Thiobacillaceae bacterium]